MIRRLWNVYRRWCCRMLEAAAGSRGDYATAHHWLKEADRFK